MWKLASKPIKLSDLVESVIWHYEAWPFPNGEREIYIFAYM